MIVQEAMERLKEEVEVRIHANHLSMMRAEAERDRYRNALEIIAGNRQCANNLMSDKDIARKVLEVKP